MPDSGFAIFWALVIGVGVIGELVAVFNKRKRDTLSELTWWLMKRKWFRAAYVMGLAWYVVHTLTGGWV